MGALAAIGTLAALAPRSRLTCVVRVALQPRRLCVVAWHAHAAAATPRARNSADRTAEMGDDLAAAATGHTLPRPVGRPGLALAVAIVARHEAIRLAFCG